MKNYEYIILQPSIKEGKMVSGYKKEIITTPTFFGKPKESKRFSPTYITEIEWLNEIGSHGWQLSQVIVNSFDHDIRCYYFSREIATQDQ